MDKQVPAILAFYWLLMMNQPISGLICSEPRWINIVTSLGKQLPAILAFYWLLMMNQPISGLFCGESILLDLGFRNYL